MLPPYLVQGDLEDVVVVEVVGDLCKELFGVFVAGDVTNRGVADEQVSLLAYHPDGKAAVYGNKNTVYAVKEQVLHSFTSFKN